MSPRHHLAAALVLTALVPAAARADTLLIPFVGLNFGGDAGRNFSNAVDASQFNYGLSFGFLGGGVFGMESDFAYSPDFFGKSDVGSSSVMTIMGNVVLAIPFGGQKGFGIRPYGLVGFGLLRSTAEIEGIFDVGEENNIAWNSGGGVMVFFGSRFGVRADIRYLSTFDDIDVAGVTIIESPGKISFTRSSLGFILRF